MSLRNRLKRRQRSENDRDRGWVETKVLQRLTIFGVPYKLRELTTDDPDVLAQYIEGMIERSRLAGSDERV